MASVAPFARCGPMRAGVACAAFPFLKHPACDCRCGGCLSGLWRARHPGRSPLMNSQHQDDTERRASILIVDDTPGSRSLLAVMLANEGFDLRTAASGEEALAMIARSAPNLVLLDVVMPG